MSAASIAGIAAAAWLGAAPPVLSPEWRAERSRAQNRLASDLAIHTAVAGYCSYQLSAEASGRRCWLWGLGLEAGATVDRQHTSRGEAWSRGVFLGASPITFGSWYFRDQHRFFDFEVGFAEPFARLWFGELIGSDGASNFWGLVVGTRSFAAWGPLRVGLEASYEHGPTQLSRGFAFAAFAGLAWHYAPLR